MALLGLPWQMGIHLTMQGTQVQSLVWEDPTRCTVIKPMRCTH